MLRYLISASRKLVPILSLGLYAPASPGVLSFLRSLTPLLFYCLRTRTSQRDLVLTAG